MAKLEKDQKMMIETVRRFMAREVAPYSREMDETETYRIEIKQKCADLGFYAAVIPEEFGGMGLNLTNFCLMIEEMAKVDGSVAVTIQDNGTGLRPLLLSKNDDLKKEIFTKIASEGLSMGFAITESQSGSDTASIRTRAVRNGECYVINGSKTFITSGGMSDYYLVFAVTDLGARHRGISAFIVDAKTPGLSVGKKESKLGLRASPTTDLVLEDVVVPARYLVGEENEGFFLLMKTLDASRPTIGAQGLGIAEGALEFAYKYAKERKQFSQPIFEFQGLQWLICDMATKVEAARALLYQVTRLYDEAFANVTPLSAMSKMFCTDVAMEVTMNAVQVMGGYGCMKDYPVERMMRDAKITQIYEGTNQIQRIVIGNALKRKGYPILKI